ncbi:MAG: polysaccharide pyruvyl transferase family protein [Pelotomaculum sp.]|jgi:colanic acid/amylovoran biosynthesis protein
MEKKNERSFGLYGIEGLYNFGCEAIVRGIEKAIHKENPKAKIVYFSRMPTYDKKVISDIDLIIMDVKRNNSILVKIINKILRLLNSSYRIPNDEYQLITDNCDFIISVGGDIYTVPKVKLQKKRIIIYNKLVAFGEYALRKGKKIIIAGASIGPFGTSEKLCMYYFSHLKKVFRIAVREEVTFRYLRENGIIDNVLLVPDPAYMLARRTGTYNANGYIVFNVSPLSYKSIYGESAKGIRNCADIITQLVELFGVQIKLVPHVISPTNQDDNDYLFLEQAYNFLSDDVKKYVELVPVNNLSFFGVKDCLVKASMVIAARMHCAINAMSEGIPTVLLSYSSKSLAMAEYVYEHSQYVISLERPLVDIIEVVKKVYYQKEKINRQLQARMDKIQVDIDAMDLYKNL